ncbi:histidinol-phosphate transaminase [Burkholderiaceae bacterium DAT-1]|nr:histidinol-phosphate transaminase [Burkholderiaceae bacterium DAT-1]
MNTFDALKPIRRPEIDAIAAYHVPDASGYIKLDAMENPYGLPPALKSELGQRLSEVMLNRYPDPSAHVLRARLCKAMGVPAGYDVMLGNGSDELIQILALALARPGATLLAVEPSFVMYRMIAGFVGMQYAGVPLRDDFSLDVDAVLAEIATKQPALVFLAYPNNPTGNRFAAEDVIRIIEAAPGLVVVDEAYHAFASDSFMPRLPQYPNLVVMRTLSKLGLAGLRLGFMSAHPDWLTYFDKVRLPYNINVLSQAAASFLLDHIDVFNAQAATIRQERSRLFTALSAMPGLTVYPSEANFILVQMADAEACYAELKAQHILIKKLHGAHPMLSGCLRFTVGSPEENDRVLAVLGEWIAQRQLAPV